MGFCSRLIVPRGGSVVAASSAVQDAAMFPASKVLGAFKGVWSATIAA